MWSASLCRGRPPSLKRSSDVIVGVVEGSGLRVELLKFAGTVFIMGEVFWIADRSMREERGDTRWILILEI